MKSIFLPAFALSFILISCHRNTSKEALPANNKNDVTIIDLDKSRQSPELVFSSVLKEPKTIILETDEDCLIKRIHGIELYNDKIYIHDDKMKRLFVFDVDGKFLYEIGKPGAGPGEYIELSDFSIDRVNNVVYLWDETKKTALKYDLNTAEFVSSTHVPEIKGQSYSFLFKNDKFYINNTTKDKESMKYLLNEVDCKSGRIINKLLPADAYNKGWNGPLRLPHSNFYSKNSQSPQFIEMFSDTIVSVTDAGITASYVIKSELFVPQKEIDIINENFKTTGLINLIPLYTNGYIYQISNWINMGKYIYLEYMKGTDVFFAMFNTENGEIEISDTFRNDYLFSNGYISTNLWNSDEKGVLAILKTEDLYSFMNALSKKQVCEKVDKYEQLVNIHEDSNPILFYHEFK